MHAEIYYPVITAEMKKLPLYITSIGTTYFEKCICRPNGLESCQLLYSAGGEGIAEVNGKMCPVPEGSILFLPSGCRHDYRAVGEKWVTNWITFNGSANIFDFKPSVYAAPPTLDITARIAQIIRLRDTPIWRIKSSAMLYELLLECSEYMSDGAAAESSARLRIAPCMDYIEKHYAEPLELASIAAAADMSEEHFCRVFRGSVGMRPFEYVNSFRVQRAKELLALRPNASIEQTGRLCGFNGESYFSKVFKKYVGMSPGEYRKKELHI